MQTLKGKVAIVAGATRGAGRGIAIELGAVGATVYGTGRSTRTQRSSMKRPETIEETAELVSAAGGDGRWMRVDHTNAAQVQALIERVRSEQGRLDLLVNDVWGGDSLSEWGKRFWEQSLDNGLTMQERAVWSHIITAHAAAPLLIETAQKHGHALLIEVTDGDSYELRGNLFYDLAKISAIRLAQSLAHDFTRGRHDVTALALTPGFLRSEAMLDGFGVTEDNWRDGAQADPHFIASETPRYIGRAVAALASDPNVHEKAGQAWATWTLMREYGFTDVDGRQPDWGKYFEENVAQTA